MDKRFCKNGFSEACRLTVFGTAISLAGWCFEVVGRYAVYGVLADRGFVTLPLCPIYGITLIATYLFFGTPSRPKALFRQLRTSRTILRYALYFISVTVFSTAVELLTALVFTSFGVQLWTYHEQPFNLFGVVCLGYSLLWGVLITAFMGFVWERAYAVIKKIPAKAVISVGVSLGVAISMDFLINFVITVAK